MRAQRLLFLSAAVGVLSVTAPWSAVGQDSAINRQMETIGATLYSLELARAWIPVCQNTADQTWATRLGGMAEWRRVEMMGNIAVYDSICKLNYDYHYNAALRMDQRIANNLIEFNTMLAERRDSMRTEIDIEMRRILAGGDPVQVAGQCSILLIVLADCAN